MPMACQADHPGRAEGKVDHPAANWSGPRSLSMRTTTDFRVRTFSTLTLVPNGQRTMGGGHPVRIEALAIGGSQT